MKCRFFLAMIIVTATAFLASCSSEITNIKPEIPEDVTPVEDEGTYATFQLNLPGSTKATTFDPSTGTANDNDAADNRLSYDDVRLFIFNSVTQALEINELFDTNRKTVLVTAGDKKIFVVANAGGGLAAQFKKVADLKVGVATLDDFYALHYDAGTPQRLGTTATARTFDIEPLHTQAATAYKGMPASNTNEIIYKLQPNIEETTAHAGSVSDTGESATNSFKIGLLYMVAKARLYLGKTEANLTTGNDEVSNIFYTIRNLARRTNFVQNVVAGQPRSYYYSMYDAKTTDAQFAQEIDNASKLLGTKISTTPGVYVYVPENNNHLLRRGQSSHFSIKATFKPGEVITDADYRTSGVLYTIKKLDDSPSLDYVFTLDTIEGIPSGTYFTSLAILRKAAWLNKYFTPWTGSADQVNQANALVADEGTPGGIKYYQFLNAESWYRLDLGESTTGYDLQPGVTRGKAYNAKINSITGPGVPIEGILEDDTRQPEPVVTMTYISATVEIKNWVMVGQVGDLE